MIHGAGTTQTFQHLHEFLWFLSITTTNTTATTTATTTTTTTRTYMYTHLICI